MFSFRRKPKKHEEPPPIPTSPSLPDLKKTVQEIPWPEDLVDVDAIRKHKEEEQDDDSNNNNTDAVSVTAITEDSHAGIGRPSVASVRTKGAASRISFTTGREPVMFHKPFYRYPDSSSGIGVPTPAFASSSTGEASVAADGTTAPISSFYMTLATPPEALNQMRKKRYERTEKTDTSTKPSQRRAKVPPTFNIMVVGSRGTGKSSLLRLLLETAEVSPSATKEQRAALAKFLRDSSKPTSGIHSAAVEICESKFDRILLSVIDTPGLDFQEGKELKLERQLSTILKHVDAQYADTMNEESKVVRQQKGDQHVHLCIYMIDPASIISAVERRTLYPSVPTKTRSETTISNSYPPELVPDTSSGDESEDEEEEEGPLSMTPAEIKAIRRISNRSNVLPVIAHADSLTDTKLQAVKEAVRKGMADAGIDFGVFGPIAQLSQSGPKPTKKSTNAANGNGSTNGHAESVDETIPEEIPLDDDEQEDGEDEERKSRPVIKLRPSRHRKLSRSRSRRRDLASVAEEMQPTDPESTDLDSIANIRFSAHVFAKHDISSLLPFALITPENQKRSKRQKAESGLNSPATPVVTAGQHLSISTDEIHHENQEHLVRDGVQTPTSAGTAQSHNVIPNIPKLPQGPPADMKGVFVRKFRWGTIDVLDPKHCDFAALRTAILSTHLKFLKVHTREVLYEKYRTEKLLVRRATKNISEEEKNRLLEDLGI